MKMYVMVRGIDDKECLEDMMACSGGLEVVGYPCCRLFETEVMVCKERGPPKLMTHNII